MKLHLGCGGDYLDGWVNVDKYDYVKDTSRTGSKYDIKADILHLPFKRCSATEVLIVHVLEHFYRWETIRVLKDFYRILRSGGRLTVEMPDLNKCVDWFISGGRDGGKRISTPLGPLNKGFTQFYGNQWDELPYETHHYVWCMDEFVEVLQQVGFKVESADHTVKYHMRGRDMRVVSTR